VALAPLDLQASGLALAGARRLELGHQRRLVELGDGAQLRGDIEQVYDDIFSGKRAVSFPLSPPPGRCRIRSWSGPWGRSKGII
jgi:hypothetical protein